MILSSVFEGKQSLPDFPSTVACSKRAGEERGTKTELKGRFYAPKTLAIGS